MLLMTEVALMTVMRRIGVSVDHLSIRGNVQNSHVAFMVGFEWAAGGPALPVVILELPMSKLAMSAGFRGF